MGMSKKEFSSRVRTLRKQGMTANDADKIVTGQARQLARADEEAARDAYDRQPDAANDGRGKRRI